MANKRFYEKQRISCSTGEVVHGYSRYLGTRHWQEMRQRVAEASSYMCIRCNGIFKTNYSIHHNSYKRLGKEKLSDLSFYCNKCHAVIHNNRKKKRGFNKQYNSIISSKMCNMTEEQIERVLSYIEKVANEYCNGHSEEKSTNVSGKKSHKKFYAIKKGKQNNIIVDSWADCYKLVVGHPGAKYKGFSNREEAEEFLKAD